MYSLNLNYGKSLRANGFFAENAGLLHLLLIYKASFIPGISKYVSGIGQYCSKTPQTNKHHVYLFVIYALSVHCAEKCNTGEVYRDIIFHLKKPEPISGFHYRHDLMN